MGKPRLSGFNYYDLFSYNSVNVNGWQRAQPYTTYGYCTDTNCEHRDEHNYAFDGQVFYKKREQEGEKK